MKNSSLVLFERIIFSLFLLILFFGTETYSQTPQYYNLNNGTSSNGFPFAQTSGKAVNTLFLPGAFGIPSGKQITTVYFRMSTSGSRTYTDLRILMAQDTITNLTTGTFYSGLYDTVYYNASVSLTSTAGNWMAITLNKPFYYDSTKSLILHVGLCGSSGSGGNVYNTTLSGLKRVWSVGGCPFVPYSGGDAATLNFGMDVTSALSGTYNIPGGCFRTISSAVSALNKYGVSGAVTFNISAGYTETAPAGGLILGSSILNASTSSVNKLIFQKNGTGTNPTVTAPVGTTTNLDGIWSVQGTDYLTLNGINLQESASNTTATTQMEWGYAFLKLSASDGCQYDTVKNCTVTLNKTNTASKGIYFNNHIVSSTTALTLTSVSGANSNNKIFSNTVTNAYMGIYAYGSSDANYYDLNNYIGSSSTTGNTVTNFGGSSSATYGIYASYQNNLNVYYNTVNGATGNTTTSYGIYTGTGLNSTVYIRYNTVTLTPSSSGYAIYNAMGGTGTSNSIYINNNYVQNCTTTSTFGGISNNASCYNLNIYSNQILNNNITTTGESYGIYTPGDVVSTLSVYSNSVYSITNSSTGTVYGICNYPATTTTSNIYQNSIYSIGSAGRVYGIFCRNSSVASIYRNNVYALSTSGTSYYLYGHYYMSVTTLNSYNNFISDINTPSANLDLAISGITINSDVTTANLFYNTIFLNETSSGAVFGTACIYANTTPAVDLRNNILVNTSTPKGTGSTVAYRRSSATLTSYAGTSNNNCLYAGTPGLNNLLFYDGTNSIQTISAFRTFVLPRDASSFTELPPFLNISSVPYNLHLNTTDTTQCEKGGIPVSSPISITNDFDNGSRNSTNPDVGADEFSGVPDIPNIAYLNLPNTSSTLNITTVNFAYINDRTGINVTPGTAPRLYYKKSSNNNTFADNTSSTNGWKWVESSNTSSQFDFTIDYSKLFGGTVSYGDKIMYFVIAQDILGVPKVNAKTCTFTSSPSSVDLTSAQFPVTGSVNYYMITSSSPLAGNYTISLSLFNKITGKNLEPKEFSRKVIREIEIEDYINPKEKDKNGKIIPVEDRNRKFVTVEVEEKYFALSENGVKYTGPAYVAFTPEIRKRFNLSDNLEGNYANISSAVGDLNSAGISAAVTFSLLDANYGDTGTPEDFPITLYSINGASPVNTVTFKPSTVTPTISGSSASSIFKLDGADYILINGSNSGGTDRSLTIENTRIASNTAAIWLASGSAANTGASNNIIKNCNIKTGTNSSTTYGIYLSGISFGTSAYDNDNNTIQNNFIYKAYYGIYSINNSAGIADNLNISDNTLGTPAGTTTDYLGYMGIYQTYSTGSTLYRNIIQNLISTVTGKKGIYLYSGVTNATVSDNKIYSIKYTGTGGYGARGIDINTANSSSNILIFNNLIYDIIGDGDPASFTYMPIGISIDGTTGGIGIYNNSIYLYGDAYNSGSTYAGLYSCIFVNTTALSLDIRNNILMNTIYKTGIAGAKAYSFYSAASNAAYSNINCNDYYVSGANGILAFLGTDVTTLSGWKTATGQDKFSLNTNPGFNSTTDLSINTSVSTCWGINGGGYPLSSVTTDFNGNPRSASLTSGSTDIGAYEFTPSVSSPVLSVSGAITDGGTSYLYYSGTTLASITWHSGSGTLPSGVTAIFYPQVNPPNPTGNYANENFVITVTGGSGFTYDITYYYNLARMYTIGSESDIRLAKYDASVGWEQYPATPNITSKSITVTGISSFSTFTFGDNNSPLPVKMKSFTSNVTGRDVRLNWITESENNSKGFEVLRSLIGSNYFVTLAFIKSKGNQNNGADYWFSDLKLNSGKYNYILKQIDQNGNVAYFKLGNFVEIGIPEKFNLSQNYPNPFNPVTKIDFELPLDSKISIKLYDVLGKEIKTLVNSEFKTAGFYYVELDASNLSSGSYFYRMIANSLNKDYIFTKKMMVIK